MHTSTYIPGSPLGGSFFAAELEGGRLRELLVAVLRPEHALLSAHSETVGFVHQGLELILQLKKHTHTHTGKR